MVGAPGERPVLGLQLQLVALPLAALGKLNPMVAAASMASSSLAVVANALRRKGGFEKRSGG